MNYTLREPNQVKHTLNNLQISMYVCNYFVSSHSLTYSLVIYIDMHSTSLYPIYIYILGK